MRQYLCLIFLLFRHVWWVCGSDVHFSYLFRKDLFLVPRLVQFFLLDFFSSAGLSFLSVLSGSSVQIEDVSLTGLMICADTKSFANTIVSPDIFYTWRNCLVFVAVASTINTPFFVSSSDILSTAPNFASVLSKTLYSEWHTVEWMKVNDTYAIYWMIQVEGTQWILNDVILNDFTNNGMIQYWMTWWSLNDLMEREWWLNTWTLFEWLLFEW